MRLKNSLFLILFFVTNAFALTKFKQGTHILEGKISVSSDKEVYFLVNAGSFSQTKFKLSGELSKLKDQDGSNAELELVIPEDTFSALGEARIKKIIRFLHPKDDAKNYF